MRPNWTRARVTRFLLLSTSVTLLVTLGVAAATGSSAGAAGAPAVTSASLGSHSPTFVGPAGTGCASGCQLLTGPFLQPAITSSSAAAPQTAKRPLPDSARALPVPRVRVPHGQIHAASTPTIPTVSCEPLGPGCDTISSDKGGAVGVRGLNAVQSAKNTTNIFKDIEPPDQGLCAGNGSVLETNNIGEIQIFNTSLQKTSPVVSLDTVMGLTQRGWSSGGDISCLYDPSNGGHWFITEFVSASPESQGGPFAGCFAGVPNTCYEAIAVTTGAKPAGPYNVYFLNANYNPAEPGYPSLLNDFTKIGATRDAFLMFYDEFPNGSSPGFGGGGFNGAQQFAFNKTALETGQPVIASNGAPNPAVNVAIENMGLLNTPDGTCSSDKTFQEGGVTCWYSVIPATAPDPSDWDNANNGSGFMVGTLDYYANSDNRLAVWAWTGLHNLVSNNCSKCSSIGFSGELFRGVNRYYDPPATVTGTLIPQKAGPIPLGNECRKAKLSIGDPPPVMCPESGLATNGDNITQLSQAQGQLWAVASTETNQTFASQPSQPEVHMGASYWVLGTKSFDTTGAPSLTNQGYVSPAHEDLTMPVMAGQGAASDGGTGRGIMAFTLAGNGGLNGADDGGFYPSTAYGRLTKTSTGLIGSQINIADLGQSPEDGFSEYQGYPGQTQARWGDYSAAIFLPNSGGRVYFATNYIQSPNCLPPDFTLTVGTCGGTRDGLANWGTSVNYVVP
jgi:hypothetical protein